ncbi:MAG: sugar phosphate isomerase/epimerase [Clostridia bacterium]|nr:sugar phosphate isomerase/epimerase [Clostridia bacterium]
MEIGISLFSRMPYKEQIKCMKAVGVSRTFIDSHTLESDEFDDVMACLAKNDIICETMHSPFDKINDMWKEDETGDAMLQRLLDSVDKCVKYNVPVLVVHVSSGRPMPEINEIGNARYKKLIDHAREKGVKIALENLRYLENLEHLMKLFPDAGFCWDCGHEYCATPGVRYMPLFGDRLAALHIHDNSCVLDSDDHVLPFDGKIDMETVASDIAANGYKGTLMLEISKFVKYGGEQIYEALTNEQFFAKAAEAARRLAAMVEEYSK